MTTIAKPPIRPYRRFLTSALHRQFVQALPFAAVICWDNAFWVSPKTSLFWSWFPVSSTGIRALLFFISSLIVFILHVATLRIGRRTSGNLLIGFFHQVISLSTLQIFLWYTASAWWYGEVYVYSMPEKAGLGWVIRGGVSSPDRLNERPIYLRAMFQILAFAQTCCHLYYDASSLRIPTCPRPSSQEPDQKTHKFPALATQIATCIPAVLVRSLCMATGTALLGPFIYTALLRRFFWSAHLFFAKLIFDIPRADARPPGWPPAQITRALASGALLVFLWQGTSCIFTTLMLHEPLQKNIPLSAESKDPNGTLLNGLKAKRDIVKTYAFWELSLIARLYPDRRKAIFADIERKNGAMWAQMQNEALVVIRATTSRIASSTAKPKLDQQKALPQPIETLPRIVTEVSHKPIRTATPPPRTTTAKLSSATGTLIKSLGSTPQPLSPPLAKVKGLLEYTTPTGLTQNPSSYSSTNPLAQYWDVFLAIPYIGTPFRTSPSRRLNATILGTPYTQTALLVDATDAVTRILVASLAEDVYGKAIAGVPDAVRTFTKAIVAIEEMVQAEVKMVALQGGIEEIEIVLSWLKASLAELLSAFQVYLTDVGLGTKELGEAKRATELRVLFPATPSGPVDAVEKEKATDLKRGPRQQQMAKRTDLNAQTAAAKEAMEQDRRRGAAQKEKAAQRRIEAQRGSSEAWREWAGPAGFETPQAKEPLFPAWRKEMEMVG